MAFDLDAFERRRISWADAVRIQPWRHPEVSIWRALVDEDELPAILGLLSLTDPDIYRALGDLEKVSRLDWMRGEGSEWVMPAFTFGGPGRFNNEFFAAFYAARERETAIAETVYHQEELLRATSEPPMEARMRVLRAEIECPFCLVLGDNPSPPALYHQADYSTSQAFAAASRAAGIRAIRFQSVRRAGGQCAALYQPAEVKRCRAAELLVYLWDGTSITGVEARTPIDWR